MAAAPAKIRVDKEHHGFVDANGKAFIPFGVSYYRPGTGWAPQLWKQFDGEATRRDFDRLKGLGANVVRVFISFGSFYTAQGQLDPAGLAAFDRLLDLADEAGLYVHPTGPDGWEGMPAWTHPLAVFSNDINPACRKALDDWWKMFATRYRGRATIWAYDLRNEPTVAWDTPYMRSRWDAWRAERKLPVVPVPDPSASPVDSVLGDYQRFREDIATTWVAHQADAIHAADPSALVTVGLLQWSVPAQRIDFKQYTGFRPDRIAKHLDFMELHFYPLALGVYRYENPAAEDANLAVLECMARECAKPGLPLVIAEFGWYGGGALDASGKPASEEDQATWCRKLVETTAPVACGWLNWGLHDHPQAKDVSRLTGMLTVDGKDKAWAREFCTLATRMNKTPPVFQMPARPDLPWDDCTTNRNAMDSFREDYLKAFIAARHQ